MIILNGRLNGGKVSFPGSDNSIIRLLILSWLIFFWKSNNFSLSQFYTFSTFSWTCLNVREIKRWQGWKLYM
jgi:hypothetical protein